jgi:hypothetical protein
MKKQTEKDIKGVVTRQNRYATLAKKEGDYASKQAAKETKKKEPEMAKDSRREAKIAYAFSDYRKGLADDEKRKLRKNHPNG